MKRLWWRIADGLLLTLTVAALAPLVVLWCAVEFRSR